MSDYIQENINNNVPLPRLEAETKIINEPEIVSDKKTVSRLKVAFNELLNVIKEEKLLPFVKHFSTKLKIELENVDKTWNQRYGDRYQTLKQRFKKVKTWYGEEKSKVEAGAATPIDRKQAQWKTKASEVGVSVAQKEEKIKHRLLEMWKKN